jgi:hypothetical protein
LQRGGFVDRVNNLAAAHPWSGRASRRVAQPSAGPGPPARLLDCRLLAEYCLKRNRRYTTAQFRVLLCCAGDGFHPQHPAAALQRRQLRCSARRQEAAHRQQGLQGG